MDAELDIERIAAQIHRFYVNDGLEDDGTGEMAVEFEALPEFLRADNRAAARRIGDVLALVGLRLEAARDEPWSEAQREEVRRLIRANLDMLAEGEHNGWMETRLREGWRLGLRKDIDRREHHLLVSWQDFAEQIRHNLQQNGEEPSPVHVERKVERERQKDRDSVVNYVRIVGDAGYRIVREHSPAEGRHPD